VTWRVEILNDTVVAEIAALPADMQARFLRLSERIGQAGLESLGECPLCHGDRPESGRGSGVREEDTEDAARRDPACTSASKGDHMTIPFEKLKARLLANPKVKVEYEALAPEFEISAELVKARLRAGLSQAELAARMGTSQSTIARLESGQTLPSTKTLLRYAEATGSRFHVRLSAA